MTEKTFLQRVAEREAENAPPPPPAPPKPLGPPLPPLLVDADSEQARRRRYAEKALRAECDLVAFAANGTRNHTLNKAAFNIARFITDGILTPEEVNTELTIAAQAAGLPDAEIRTTMASANRGAEAKPHDKPAVPESSVGANVLEVDATTLTGTSDETPAAVTEKQIADQFVDGGTFILDIPATIPALWGVDDEVLWAEGESLMIAGPMGLGKTTLAGQLIRAQLGIDTECLGLPVAARTGRVLYLAMDRPAQIARAMARQFGAEHRDILTKHLVIWKGPPPADVAKNPGILNYLAEKADADTVYVDSLKDAAIGLSEDEVGAGYNRARQHLLAHGRQLAELHHTVKRSATGGAPNHVADVYGSAWLTNGTGSIILLGGEPGDPIVSFKHPRQPAHEVGPYQLLHDQDAGTITVHHTTDLRDIVAHCGAEGLTAKAAAVNLFDTDKPSRGQVEKARRKLVRLADAGQLIACEGAKGRGETATAWFLASTREV